METSFFSGSHATLLGLINSWVHVIMYFYYFLTSFRPELKNSLWWKKHITQVQLIQFLILMVHFGLPLVLGYCNYPVYLLFIGFTQNVFMFTLFADIYVNVLHQEANAQIGNEFVTFTCEPTRLLQFYTSALKRSTGVTFRRQKITTLAEILPSTVPNAIVINCLGLGSSQVLGDDGDSLVATRGQIRRVEAPWMFQVLISDAGYVIPNTGAVTLGGTKQKGDCDLLVREGDSEGISRGCCALVPGLGKAPVVGDLVGLRPTRVPCGWSSSGSTELFR
ncbi:hypothetical protein pipiens_016274 [Culex pipiens pipiens]|uniref:FAD dependent oxidoreductase domain-containing protein n=1 Tax=Culex pipiens pipiens TaxID=38569 RepID=A0ABD1CNB8_CULPP